eukprot:1605244-Amphidinium_carterae.2
MALEAHPSGLVDLSKAKRVATIVNNRVFSETRCYGPMVGVPFEPKCTAASQDRLKIYWK